MGNAQENPWDFCWGMIPMGKKSSWEVLIFLPSCLAKSTWYKAANNAEKLNGELISLPITWEQMMHQYLKTAAISVYVRNYMALICF